MTEAYYYNYILQIRLTSLFFEDQDLSEEECSKELAKIKHDMMKAFHYSQGTILGVFHLSSWYGAKACE